MLSFPSFRGSPASPDAKQADDETLFKTAMRIKGRAVRRVGELLKAVEPAKGGQPFQNPTRGATPPSRQSIAAAAGLSPDQAKEALRVASIPKREFELPVQPVAHPAPFCAIDAGTPLAHLSVRRSTT